MHLTSAWQQFQPVTTKLQKKSFSQKSKKSKTEKVKEGLATSLTH
jgi:hypothetical protein